MSRARDSQTPTPHVLFGVFQTGQRANGGVESVTQLLEHLPPGVVLTQTVTPTNPRWTAAGHLVETVKAPHAMPGYRRPPSWARLRRVVDMLGVNLRTAALIRRRGVEVVHCNDPSAFWHMRLGAALAGATVVYNVRDTLDGAAMPWLRRLKWRLKFALAHRIVVLSREMKAFYVERLKLPSRTADRIEVIPSIVDERLLAPVTTDRREALRRRFGLSPDVFAVGYVAGFNAKKGQAEFLAKAGPLLKAAAGRLQVVFIGDFDPASDLYAAECARLSEELGLAEVVRCAGATSEVADWYAALDAVVLASRYEGLARCMIEGMAAGLPVVSFDVCSARETLEVTGAGLVARQGDYGRQVDHLLRLAANADERRAMGEAGRTHAARVFRGPTVAQAYADVYAGLRRVATETR